MKGRAGVGREGSGGRALVSVVLPVYNGKRFLRQAVESVLRQVYRPIELIVVDDGSSDGSAALAESFTGIRCLRRPHRGLSAALNTGLQAARGRLLAFIDADDLWTPDKLDLQAAALEKDPELDMVFGLVRSFTDNPFRPGPARAGYCKGAMLIRREAFMRVGTFDERWRIGDFIDWYKRARDLGLKSGMAPRLVLHRRIHGGNMGRREISDRRDYVRILKAALDRRRGASPGKNPDSASAGGEKAGT